MTQLLFTLLILATNVYPSASAAADTKAHHAHKAQIVPQQFPTVPANVIEALSNQTDNEEERAAQIKTIDMWIQKDPDLNKNGVYMYRGLKPQRSVLSQIIRRAYHHDDDDENYYEINNEFRTYLRQLLSLKPYVGYRLKFSLPDRVGTVLSEILEHVPSHLLIAQNKASQLEFAQQIIDLLREQGIADEEIEAEIATNQKMAAHLLASENPWGGAKEPHEKSSDEYRLELSNAVQEYLRDLRAAEITEEKLKKHLLPELAPIAAEYVAPLKKKGSQASAPTGKSPASLGSGKPTV